jgi:hypothetical protein
MLIKKKKTQRGHSDCPRRKQKQEKGNIYVVSPCLFM